MFASYSSAAAVQSASAIQSAPILAAPLRARVRVLQLGATTSTRFGFEALRVAEGSDTVRIDGSFHLSMPETIQYSSFTPIELARVSLRISYNGRTATLDNVTSQAEIRFSNDEFRYTLQGRVADSGGVSIDMSTEAPFHGVGSVRDAGTMRLSGANTSAARATVSSPNRMTIEVDADGDGEYEKTLDELSLNDL